ncbi:MAG TPA: flagellin [Sphingomicrobium sp.]|nr:flagellin [Sphingomicrobium sp.]
MGLNVISNYAANVAHRHLSATDMQATASLAKLSSGSRVVTAKDDAAAMAIGSRISSEVAALKQASVNAGQASSMLQIADGAMARVGDILTRMKTLAVQASSGQLGDTERGMLDTEYQALLKEIDRIAEDTEFNGNKLVGGGEVQTITPTAVATDLQAADGFASIKFDQDVGDAAFQFSWDQSSTTLTLTNKKTGASESVNVGSTAITDTEEVRFAQLGATVTLNADFDKAAADWGPAANASTVANTTGALVSAALDANNAASGEALAALDTVDIDVAGTASYATLTIDNIGTDNDFTLVEVDGKASTTVDLSAAGTKRVTLENSRTGDRITVDLTLSAAWDGVAGAISLNELDATAFAAKDPDAGNFTFKLGTGTTADVDTVTIAIDSVSTKALGLDGSTIADTEGADEALTNISKAIDRLNTARANIGASQNRLEFAAANLSTTIENQEAARSALLDLDVAAEMTRFTSKQVLMQAGVAMLAQANQMPQNLMRLLG